MRWYLLFFYPHSFRGHLSYWAQQAQGFSHGHEHLLNWRRFVPQQNSYYIHHRLVCCRGWQHKSQVSIYSTVSCAQLSSLHHIVSCGATTFSTLASYASAHVYKYFGVLVGISFFGLFINMLPSVDRFLERMMAQASEELGEGLEAAIWCPRKGLKMCLRRLFPVLSKKTLVHDNWHMRLLKSALMKGWCQFYLWTIVMRVCVVYKF